MAKITCKLCSRRFASPRALAGHMRCHSMAAAAAAAAAAAKQQISSASSASTSFAAADEDVGFKTPASTYGLRENPKRSLRVVDAAFSDRESEAVGGSHSMATTPSPPPPMLLSFHTTTAPLFGHRLPAPDMSFLQDDDDVHSEVTDALLGFVYDPLDASNAALDKLLSLPPNSVDAAVLAPLHGATGAEWQCGKRQRIGGGSQQVPALVGALKNEEYVQQLPLPPTPPPAVPVPTQVPEPLVFARGADANKQAGGGGGGGGACQSVLKSAARQRRKRISEKTAELARLIPGAHKLNTAEMLEEAARHVKLLQAQVGVLALMGGAAGSNEEEKMPSAAMAQERMHALLACGSLQERLAAEGRCLVPKSLVDTVAKDDAVKANPVVRRDLGRFAASLRGQ